MWYAIEHAYGSHVVNNGPRANKIYEFTRRALRNAWVEAGPLDRTAPGYRQAVTAHEPAVRASDARERYDGDDEAYAVLARERVDRSAALDRYREILIDYDWCDPAHLRWVATAKEREILSWARDTAAAQAE